MRRARTFGTVRKLPSGRWQARYLDADGHRHSAPTTFATKADANVYLARIETEMTRGEWIDPRLTKTTFADWVERWRPTAAHLRPGTLALYDYLLRRFLLPEFAAVELRKLDTMRVRAWLARLHKDAEVTPTTIAKAYRLLRRILNTAVEARYLLANPCTIKGAGVEAATEMRHLTIVEVHALADEIDARYRALVLVAAYGGLRWGELLGLRRKHIDIAAGQVQVAEQATEVRGKIITSAPTKTTAGRRKVILPKVAMIALRAHLKRYVPNLPDALVFANTNGGYLLRSNFSRGPWRRATIATGLTGVRFHDLRHTAATLAATTGATTRELMARLGHSSPAAALRYQHVMEERQDAIATVLDGLARKATRTKKVVKGTQRARSSTEKRMRSA